MLSKTSPEGHTEGVLDMLQPIAPVAILAALLSAWMARRVTDPLNRLDLKHPLDNDAYEELPPCCTVSTRSSWISGASWGRCGGGRRNLIRLLVA